MRRAGAPEAAGAAELADLFCRSARRRIAARFAGLTSNDDGAKYAAARRLLDGRYAWLEAGLAGPLPSAPAIGAAPDPGHVPQPVLAP